MEYIVDRFEEKFVVLEDNKGCTINIPLNKIDINIKCGDVVIIDSDGNILVDKIKTIKRKNIIDKKIKDLWI